MRYVLKTVERKHYGERGIEWRDLIAQVSPASVSLNDKRTEVDRWHLTLGLIVYVDVVVEYVLT